MAGDAPQQLLLLAVSIFCPLAWPARGGLGHHLARTTSPTRHYGLLAHGSPWG